MHLISLLLPYLLACVTAMPTPGSRGDNKLTLGPVQSSPSAGPRGSALPTEAQMAYEQHKSEWEREPRLPGPNTDNKLTLGPVRSSPLAGSHGSPPPTKAELAYEHHRDRRCPNGGPDGELRDVASPAAGPARNIAKRSSGKKKDYWFAGACDTAPVRTNDEWEEKRRKERQEQYMSSAAYYNTLQGGRLAPKERPMPEGPYPDKVTERPWPPPTRVRKVFL
ncbi:hypothetical protein MCOR27_009196 [Pyricularia oryzae]|nr:hypothetical protein MCOR01_005385 [Pyricularia oryzae]KAI6253803.1 hypothetical protein MCOR19_009651 [Pyricularia oryzae]KAI6270123.1 hypothetical protein MCOR26_008397 [Pyricularia oryzae]KAI6270619.1 hypothetical protein MCOR27_009196 [Pyricularia oryzae]KAI6286238.1 hypothetical protein MCOR34_010917 [Pyricularia oryzae]